MCFIVKCSKCGKKSWGGCGQHLKSLFRNVPDSERCKCNDVPKPKKTDVKDD